MPNSDVLSETLINESTRPLRRVELSFYISYNADADAVRSEIAARLNAHGLILGKPAPSVAFDGFGESAVRCTAYAWSATDDYSAAKTAVKDVIYAVLRELGAEPSSRKLNVSVSGAKEGKDE